MSRPAGDVLLPFRPGVDGAWDRAAAAHLARRAGFGMPEGLVSKVLELGPEAAPRWLLEERPEPDDVRFTEEVASRVGSLESAQASWVYRMLLGASPAREKLVLFWHGHFATSARKVEDVGFMLDQIALFRSKGPGPFEDLLLAVSRDPAMLVWLDGNMNRRGKPNENYARELMELFSLGIGNYTEGDIKEAARAFTGWHVKDGRFWYNERAHDGGEKLVFGKTGAFGGEDVVRLSIEHPACPELIARKLFEHYVHPSPDAELRRELGRALRERGMRIGDFLAALLASRVFYSTRARRSLVATPVDFAVGALRTLEARAGARAVSKAIAAMGQELLAPPSVKGWDAGHAWLNSTTLLARYGFAAAAAGLGGAGSSLDLAAEVPWSRLESAAGGIIERFFPEGLEPSLAGELRSSSGGDPKALAAGCLQLPESQFI
ncbi:MAG: DUF1800 domain-containing protein [Planctomycetes bacterium]|nr:DUF1800 domain-containing protein [Planctomycetota bacterium]